MALLLVSKSCISATGEQRKTAEHFILQLWRLKDASRALFILKYSVIPASSELL